MAHQGRFPPQDLEFFEIPPKYRSSFLHDSNNGRHANWMQAALIHADRLITVSEGYAKECQTSDAGSGLERVVREQNWKLKGIVNGIDDEVWNPATDLFLRSDGYSNYTVSSLNGKAICKTALQNELGLNEDPEMPLLSYVGRLDFQKGIDLIEACYEALMEEGVQLVLLGSGQTEIENQLREMESRNPSQCRAWIGFSVKMVHRIIASSDILLMPSRFEPCGLTQLYALAYGTVPVVRATGGLRDTVLPFDPYSNTGDGWLFEENSAESLLKVVKFAIETYRSYPKTFRSLQERGMGRDLSWHCAAATYIDVIQGTSLD